MSRQLKSATYATKLPNVQAGEYVVIENKTNYENASGMAETLIMMREKNGSWKANGYFLKRASQ